MPALAGEALLVASGDGSVELDHRLAPLDRSIRTARDDAAGLQEALPGVRSGQPFPAEAAAGKMEVADGVGGLHGGNHPKLRKTGNVRRVDDLRVLHPPPRLRDLPLAWRHRIE